MTLRVSGTVTASLWLSQLSCQSESRSESASRRLGLRLAGVTHWQISDDHDAVTVIRRRRTQIIRHDKITSNLLVFSTNSVTVIISAESVTACCAFRPGWPGPYWPRIRVGHRCKGSCWPSESGAAGWYTASEPWLMRPGQRRIWNLAMTSISTFCTRCPYMPISAS